MTQYLSYVDTHLSERMAHESRTDTSFADVLTEFKRRGSNLLVVGPPSERARAAICRRLLGDDGAGIRRRLFVETGGSGSCLDRYDGRVTPDTTRCITCPTPTRGAGVADRAGSGAATEPTGTTSPTSPDGLTDDGRIPHRRVTESGLATLACAINEEIGVFADRGGTLDPAELRLCFDSLTPLVAGNDTVAVRRFLQAIAGRVRSCCGMAHYHLSAGRRDDVVVDLAPAFDAVIELRIDDDRPEQRWHVSDRDLHTDWLPV
jgi:hypothetical protein